MKKYYNYLWVFLCLSTYAVFTVQAQVPCNQRLMRDINFSYTGGGTTPERWQYNQTTAAANGFIFDDAAFAYVPFPGNFSNVRMNNVGANNNTRQYAVVTNPNVLNPAQYASIPTPNGMLVINPMQGESDNYFSYTILGLIPGNVYRIEMQLHNVLALDCANQMCGDGGTGWTNFAGAFQVNGANTIFNTANPGDKGAASALNWTNSHTSNNSGTWNVWGNPIENALRPAANGLSALFTANVTVPAGNSAFTINFVKTGVAHPIVLGVEYIRIYGCEREEITVSTGSTTVCEGEEVRLTAFGIGTAGTNITWTRDGTTIQTSTSRILNIAAPTVAQGPVTYTATGEWSSASITLTPRLCCNSAGGTNDEVFRESFSNVTFNGNNRANIPGLGDYAWTSYTYNPGPGNINEGQYAVVRRSCDGGWWCMPHSPAPLPERTGDGGGALLVNPEFASGPFFYRRRLENLCVNTMYEFSAWYASLAVGGEVPAVFDFEVWQGLPESGGTMLESTRATAANVPAAGILPAWHQTSVTFNTPPTGNPTFYVQLVNRAFATGGGRDVMIDDIVVTKCTPRIDIWQGTERDSIVTCETTNIQLEIKAAFDIPTLIGGSPSATVYYQWQSATNPNGPWTNIGSPITIPTYTIPSLEVGTTMYYRAKVSAFEANAATGIPPLATDCGNDAMSNVFRVEIMSGTTISATTPGSRCGAGTVELRATTSPAGGTVNWYDAATEGTLLGTSASGAAWTTPSISQTTTFYAEAADSPCGSSRVAVVATVTPSNTITLVSSSKDATVCVNTAIPTIKFATAGATGATFSGLPTGVSGTWANDTITISGTPTTTVGSPFNYTITLTGGCGGGTETGTITVNAKPTVTIGSNSPVCEGATLNLNSTGSTGAGTYAWSGPNSFTDTAAAPSITNVTTAASGTYKLVITSSAGCKDSTTINVTVNSKPIFTLSSNSPVCEGATLNLYGLTSSGGTFAWSGPNGFTDDTPILSSITNVTTAATGTYKLVITSAAGCKDSTTTDVTVNAKPTVTIGSNSPVCEGATLNLNSTGSTGAGTYTWSGPNGFTDTAAAPSITNVTTAASGTYKLVITSSAGCKDSTTTNVTINAKPTVTIGSNSPVCEGATLNLNSTGSTGAGTYAWSGPNGFTNTAAAPSITNVTTAASGTYKLVITNAAGCKDSTTTSVTVNPKPTISILIGHSGTVNVGGTTQLQAGGLTGNWTSGNTAIATVDASGEVTGVSSGTVEIYFETTPEGCRDTIEITVSSIGPIKPGYTQYFCPGDTPTLIGGGQNIDKWQWCKKNDPLSCLGVSTNLADTLLTLPALTAADDGTIWVFYAYDAAQIDTLRQEITLTKRPDFAFNITNPTPVCKDANEIITATTTIVPVPANIQYAWGSSGFAGNNTTNLATSTVGLGQKLFVRGKAEDYCEKLDSITYDVVYLSVARKGTWASTVYDGESVTLRLDTAGTVLPTNGKIEYVWEISTNPISTWTPLATTLADSIKNIPPSDGACYRVTATMYDALNVPVCLPYETEHCVGVTTLAIGRDTTYYYCPDTSTSNTLALIGTAENIDAYAWYQQGESEPTMTNPTDPRIIYLSPAPGDITDTKTLIGAEVTTSIWYFKVFSGANDAKQTFTIIKHDDYNFDVSSNLVDFPNPVFTCVNNNVTLTATAASGMPAANRSYSWNGGTATGSAVYPLPTSTTTPIARPDTVSVTGEIRLAVLSPGDRTSRYCPATVKIPYTIGNLNVEKSGTWAAVICKDNGTTLTLTDNAGETNGTVVPAGTELQIRWYSSPNGSNPWTALSAYNNQLSLPTGNLTATVYYKIEVSLIRTSGQQVICSQTDMTHTVTVPVFTMGITANHTNRGYCVGDNMLLTGTGTGGTSFQWFKDGNPISGQTALTYSKTFAAGDAGRYKFKAMNGSCADSITIDISENAAFNFSVPAEVTVCQESGTIQVPATNQTVSATNITYNWSATNGATGTGSTFNFPISTAGTGSITVVGRAADYCATTKTIPYTIVGLTPYYIRNPTNICANSLTPAVLEVGINGTVPLGITYDIVWEKQESSNWQTVGNGTTLSVNPPIATTYRATIIIKDAANNAICSRYTTPHTLDVLDLGMGLDEVRTICEGANLSLEGTTSKGLEWAWLDAGRNMIQSWTSSPTGKLLQNQFPTANTTYYFVARNGVCEAEQRFDITVRKNIRFVPVPPIINTCVNTPVMLNTQVLEPENRVVNYNWVVDGVLMSTGPTFEFIGKTAKTGSIEVQALETATHCATTQIVDYTVNEIVVLETSYPTTFCPNESVTLEARFEEYPSKNIPTYRWYENNVLVETGSGTHALKSFNPTNDAVYRLEVSTATCAAPVVLIQTTVEMVKMDIVLPKDTTICPGEEILILAITEAQRDFSIRWTKQGESDSIPIPMIQTGIFFRERPAEQTRYTAFFTNTGCFNTASFVVSMHPVPVIVGIEETEPRHVRFYVESGTEPYLFAVNQQTYFTFNDESGRLPIGSNIVFVKDANLCRTSMPFVMAEPMLIFPPFFTPNGILDENRTWRIRGLELFDDIELIIFDRHGKELTRKTRGEYAEWDGRYLGKPMPSTDYWFLLRVRETGREYTGHFTLIR